MRLVRAMKQLIVGLFFAAIVLVVCLPVAGTIEAAEGQPHGFASIDPLSSASQGITKFDHAKHTQLKCDQCHVRKVDAITPIMPGHSACISCQFAICSTCHEGITAVRPPVLTFPERQTFGVAFSHKTHATYAGGERRAECSSCHAVAGARTTFPAHRECYECHKAPDQVKAGEKVGGASCGECHSTSGNKKPPSQMSKAYNYRFTHQVHAQGQGIACAECHKVLGGAAVQVSTPQLKEHRGAAFEGCGACHNGRRAFGGELANNACARCHGRKMI